MSDSGGSFKTWDEAVAWLREQPGQQSLVRDSYYDDPLVDAAERYYHSPEWQAIGQILRDRSGHALDVGAGRGIASYALARDGFSVISLEPDTSNLVGTGAIAGLAKDTGLPIVPVSDVSESLPFDTAQFDVVFARAVLHHMQDLETGCRELARVLKPGGLLLAVREHVISRAGDLPVFLQNHPLHRLYGGENAYLLNQYRRALDVAGLRIVQQLGSLESPINYFPQTPETLRSGLVGRVGLAPGISSVIASILSYEPIFGMTLNILSKIDTRPGRLYSFVCEKKL